MVGSRIARHPAGFPFSLHPTEMGRNSVCGKLLKAKIIRGSKLDGFLISSNTVIKRSVFNLITEIEALVGSLGMKTLLCCTRASGMVSRNSGRPWTNPL